MMHRKILMRPIKIYESKVIKIKMCQLYLNGPVDDVINFLQIFLRTSEIDPGAWTVFRRGGLVLGDPRLPSHLELQHRDEIWTVSCCHKKVVESWSVDFRFSTPSVDFGCLSLFDNVFFICLGKPGTFTAYLLYSPVPETSQVLIPQFVFVLSIFIYSGSGLLNRLSKCWSLKDNVFFLISQAWDLLVTDYFLSTETTRLLCP